MFRSLAIIVEIAILVVVLQLPFVQYLLSDFQSSLSEWMTDIALREERAQLAKIKDNMSVQYSAMRDYQRDYLDEVLSSRLRTIQFYESYCVDSDSNPYIYGATLASFCSQIQSSPILKASEDE